MLGVDPQMTQMDADVKLAVIRVFVRDMFLMVLFNDSPKCRSAGGCPSGYDARTGGQGRVQNVLVVVPDGGSILLSQSESATPEVILHNSVQIVQNVV